MGRAAGAWVAAAAVSSTVACGGGGDRCDLESERICVGDDVYAVDACGEETLVFHCQARLGETCRDGACVGLTEAADCEAKTTCGDCTRTYPCVWCDGECATHVGDWQPLECASYAWELAECSDTSMYFHPTYGEVIRAPLERGGEQLVSADLGLGELQAFAIGSLRRGDRVEIDVLPPHYWLEGLFAIFDGNGEGVYVNTQLKKSDFADIRRDVDEAFFVVGTWGAHGGQRQYALRHVAAGATTAARRAIVYLDFRGYDDPRIDGWRPPVAPFDVGWLDARFEGRTREAAEAIVAQVRADFAAYDVDVLSSFDGKPPAAPHDTIYFGHMDRPTMGLHKDDLVTVGAPVDVQNRLDDQAAWIYPYAFRAYLPYVTILPEWVNLFANLAGAEVGHFLGLANDAEPQSLMGVRYLGVLQRPLLADLPLRGAGYAQPSFANLTQNVELTLGENVPRR